MTPYTQAESQWIVDYWLSYDNQGQKVYGAVMMMPEAWGQLPDNYRLEEAQAGAMTFRLFADEGAALDWLRQLP
jgi:hypothetical protein